MKKTAKILLLVSAIILLVAAFAFSAYAVPGCGPNGNTGTCRSHTNELVTLDDIPSRTVNAGGRRMLEMADTKKNIPLVIIVIGFDNIAYNNDYDWGGTIFNNDTSLKQYYTDMSFGQFTFEPVKETSACGGSNKNKYDKVNDGIIHVTVDQKHDDWSFQQIDPVLSWNYNYTMTKAFVSAIQKANAYINFKQYDANGNGKIENNEMALGFVVAGYEAAYQLSYDKFSFWSHAYSISDSIEEGNINNLSVPVCDGVKVDSYIGIAEDLTNNVQEPICVLAHELGHYLGLPDLYDTVYSYINPWSDYSVGFLSIMCSGMWCEDEENNTYIPASMDAFSRTELGWIKPTKITANGTYNLTSQNYNDISEQIKTVMIPTQNSNEYYIVENRQFTGWDRFLGDYIGSDGDCNGGVVVWHVDKNVYNDYYDINQVNNTDHRPAVMPLYPEYTDTQVKFIGSDGYVDDNAFFTKTSWAEKYYSSLGEKLVLPLYATGKNADKRASRTLSGIGISFPDDSSSSMNIFVDVDSHVHKAVHRHSDPTCLINGFNDCYYCSYCKKYFADKNYTVEMSREEAVIPSLGHKFKFVKTVKPMADADGYDLYECERCSTTDKRNCKKLVGWGQDKDGNWYYAKSAGVFAKGWQTLSGRDGKTHKYYFASSGIMYKSKFASFSGTKYYFDSTGAMVKSKLISVGGKKYYMGSDGAAYKSRLISVDGKKYYIGSDCVAYKSKFASLDGKKYYFGSDCVMIKSKLISVDGKKYYMGSDGVAYKSKLISVDNKKYYIGSDCVAYKSKFASLDGKKYYFGSDCVMIKSKLISVDGSKYYMGSDGVAYKSKFASLDGKKYYFGSDCVMYKSKTFSVSGVKWKADSGGVCKKV